MQNWLRRWKATWHPERYHGWGRENNYFEGWYYKIVSPEEQYAYALIPGISKGKDGHQHAFIQQMDGKQYEVVYHDFEATAFKPSSDHFEVSIGDNYFSDQRIQLALPKLSGNLKLTGLNHWPKMLGAPGIMGWYSFVPFMECYHGVVSMHHELEGTLHIDEQVVDFTGGKGYIEKDWGRSFPSSWIWIQSNHFDHSTPVSVMASVANIPWLNSHFVGYIVGFLMEGKLYRFATYTGAKMKARLGEEEVFVSFKDNRYRLEMIAHRKGGSGTLISPLSGEMVGKVNESLSSTVEVKFFEGDTLLFEGTGRNTGLEVAGTIEALLTENWRR